MFTRVPHEVGAVWGRDRLCVLAVRGFVWPVRVCLRAGMPNYVANHVVKICLLPVLSLSGSDGTRTRDCHLANRATRPRIGSPIPCVRAAPNPPDKVTPGAPKRPPEDANWRRHLEEIEPYWNLEPVKPPDRLQLRAIRTIGAPGFEPGTSPTRTVRATRLRHAPMHPIVASSSARVHSGSEYAGVGAGHGRTGRLIGG